LLNGPETVARHAEPIEALYPGPTIGNLAPAVAIDTLRHLAKLRNDDGGMLVVIGLKKDRADGPARPIRR
jgi:hypothetical protein